MSPGKTSVFPFIRLVPPHLVLPGMRSALCGPHTPNARRRSPAATAPAQTHACRSLRCAPLWHIPHISERKASDNCKANFRPLFHSHHCLELLLYVCQPRRRRAADSTLQHCAAHRAAQRQRRSKTHKPLFHISALLPDRLSELLLTALAQAPSVSIFKYGPGSRNGIVRALLKYPSVNPCRSFLCILRSLYSIYLV